MGRARHGAGRTWITAIALAAVLAGPAEAFFGQVAEKAGEKASELVVGLADFLIARPVAPIEDADDLRAELRAEIRRLRALGGADRHEIGDRAHRFAPSGPGATLVLALEGTGAYEPLLAAALANLHGTLAPRLTPELAEDIHRYGRQAFRAEMGRDSLWSGLAAGPMTWLYENPGALGGPVDWISFPSEEAEAIANLATADFSLRDLKRVISEVADAVDANPRGVRRAVAGTLAYLRAAVRAEQTPRIVVLTHSSGGRMGVKFLEALKRELDPRTGTRGVEVDLVMSFDPVREAHEAIGEVLPQLVRASVRRLRGLVGDRGDTEVMVRSRRQPGSLYRPANVRRWVSVYQLEDTEGLKMDFPRFGIRGSPVEDATHEEVIRGVGAAGHGEICYSARALELLAEEIARFAPPAPVP